MARDTDNNATSEHPNFKNSIVMLINSVDPKSGLYAGRIGIVVSVHNHNMNNGYSFEILFEGQSQSQYVYSISNENFDNSIIPFITIAGQVYPLIHPPNTIHHYQ